ncbi:MAG: GNAT family N-acetyltransferase [Bacteroidetes bacterium]|nr:GNAT family N-acetyltransferase [Bacteroidota bacterium]
MNFPTSFPTLHTPRILLRSFNAGDNDLIFDLRKSDRIAQHIIRPLMTQQSAANTMLENIHSGFSQQLSISWVGEIRHTGEVMGSCGLMNINQADSTAEIGGEMLVSGWGKGYALEAVITILNYAFNVLNLVQIEAKVLSSNRSAIALMTRIGFLKDSGFEQPIHHELGNGILHRYTLLPDNFSQHLSTMQKNQPE